MMTDVMLPKTIPEKRLNELIEDPRRCLQQKYDGVRAVVRCKDGRLEATGRSGLSLDLGYCGTQFPLDEDYTLDGELAWQCFFAFDDLSDPSRPYRERLAAATERVTRWGRERIRPVPTWTTTADKRAAFERAKAKRVEGVVLKDLDADWQPGSQPTRCVRFKFVKTADCVVCEIGGNGKRSALLGVHKDGRPYLVGRLPCGKDRVWNEINDAAQSLDHAPVVEVAYLYATEAGQLYQPRFVRVRYDKQPTPADTPFDQLEITHRGELTEGGVTARTYPEPKPSPGAGPGASGSSGRKPPWLRDKTGGGRRPQPAGDGPSWWDSWGVVVCGILGALLLLFRGFLLTETPKSRRYVLRGGGNRGGGSGDEM